MNLNVLILIWQIVIILYSQYYSANIVYLQKNCILQDCNNIYLLK